MITLDSLRKGNGGVRTWSPPEAEAMVAQLRSEAALAASLPETMIGAKPYVVKEWVQHAEKESKRLAQLADDIEATFSTYEATEEEKRLFGDYYQGGWR